MCFLLQDRDEIVIKLLDMMVERRLRRLLRAEMGHVRKFIRFFNEYCFSELKLRIILITRFIIYQPRHFSMGSGMLHWGVKRQL